MLCSQQWCWRAFCVCTHAAYTKTKQPVLYKFILNMFFFGASGAQVLVDMYLLIFLYVISWRLRRANFNGYVFTDLRYYIFFAASGAKILVDMYLLIFLHIIFRRRRNFLKPWKRLEPSRSLGKIARCASGALHGAMERYYFSMMRIIFAGLCVGRSNQSLL